MTPLRPASEPDQAVALFEAPYPAGVIDANHRPCIFLIHPVRFGLVCAMSSVSRGTVLHEQEHSPPLESGPPEIGR